ncbi:type I-C CRISPR-associated protein Cas5 [Rheinheimera sediminis]|uniref:type I-C CRISPR-associated protein Cas5c n=1 Tax=Rheinheimera sp. YQF-1 TaxID=2499626 RepID=UPI000FD9D13A|nr:type I-C CRISPR-associated protein Cas5c [Rheinheimera sp. YQF-1]RVT40632.1 type I-C CRISPR-associated protein Cas5 [Rheinheimera sp. YQF-1]
MSVNFCLEVSGDYACFTRPEMKVERVSYDVITPSAARAIFEAILWKPAIRWQITHIEVLNPINWISVRRNEVGKVFNTPNAKQMAGHSTESMGFYIEDERQQRAGLFLRDVKYRLYANLHFDGSKDPNSNYGKYAAMFERRAKKGQCFNQPYLGTREFSCDFRLVEDTQNDNIPPIEEDKDLGWMLYDLDYSDGNNPLPRFFNAAMKQGLIRVPAWDSEEVRG